MAQDTTKANEVLQNYYLNIVRNFVNQRAILLFGYSPAELEKGLGTANASKGETLNYHGIIRDAERVEFAGQKWVSAAHTGRNESQTAGSEGGTIGTAGEQSWVNFEDTIRHFYKQFELTGYAMEVSERSAAAFLRLLQAETQGTIDDARWDLNRQAWTPQDGRLAEITADGSNTFTVDNVQYLRVGMYIDLINNGTDAALASNRKITAINTSTRVVTYDGADVTTVAGTHNPCITGNWKKEINGLPNIVGPDGASFTTLHNVNGSTAGNEFWQSKVIDGGGGTFDEDLGQQLLDLVAREGQETELVITTRGIRRRYVNLLKAQKRFNDGMSGMLHGGFKTIDFNGYPMTVDDMATKGTAWFLRPSDFLWVWLGGNDFRWLRRDGQLLRMVTSPSGDKDNWRGTLYRFHDLGCLGRKYQGKFKNLADDDYTPIA